MEFEEGALRTFSDFYSSERDQLYRGVALVVGDSSLARDAVDEAMTRAWQRWDTVGGFVRPQGWVYRVAVNWAISRHRKLRREVVGVEGPEKPTTDAVPHLELADAVDRLPVKLRAVVVARFYLDWSVEMVAESLGVPLGTVKSRSNRALEWLGRELR